MLIIITIIGLIFSFLPPELVKVYLGGDFNIIKVISAALFGAVMMIPGMIALPLAAELLRKKASVSNVIIFLGVWASLKIPQISIEIKFLGLKFVFLRFIFTLTSIFIMGFIIEKLVNKNSLKEEN